MSETDPHNSNTSLVTPDKQNHKLCIAIAIMALMN